MPKYFILMGDIVGSGEQNPLELIDGFKYLISSCNKTLHQQILSPYTITLGDEFQGIACSLSGLLDSIFYIEEERIKWAYNFKLRFVGHYGEIQTPINTNIAYEMMGPGLAHARDLLSIKRQNRPRFIFDLPDQKHEQYLNRLFQVIDGIIGKWKISDYPLISDMLTDASDQEVGAKYDKNRSQIWKRRKHLLVKEYKLLKAVIIESDYKALAAC